MGDRTQWRTCDSPCPPQRGRGPGEGETAANRHVTVDPLTMNRQPHADNLLLHMQQKVVSPGSGVQSAKLISENSHPDPLPFRRGEGKHSVQLSSIPRFPHLLSRFAAHARCGPEHFAPLGLNEAARALL